MKYIITLDNIEVGSFHVETNTPSVGGNDLRLIKVAVGNILGAHHTRIGMALVGPSKAANPETDGE